MEGILTKIAGNLFLTKADFEIPAKDLNINTLVFCHSEIDMNDVNECLRHSGKGDNCYSCQPLIASTKDIENIPLLDISPEDFKDGDWIKVDYTSDLKINLK